MTHRMAQKIHVILLVSGLILSWTWLPHFSQQPGVMVLNALPTNNLLCTVHDDDYLRHSDLFRFFTWNCPRYAQLLAKPYISLSVLHIKIRCLLICSFGYHFMMSSICRPWYIFIYLKHSYSTPLSLAWLDNVFIHLLPLQGRLNFLLHVKTLNPLLHIDATAFCT